ncbi:MAG: nicotinamide mononucleotide transporter [Prevotella sp.]|nr:nicotinamide mononucleotide transporter [Prevotella sp.]
MVHYLDFIGAVLGIIYILLEYRASIWLWAVSIIMPLVDMMLYFRAGLYADFGMAIYYALAAIYGYAMWRWKINGNVNDNVNINDNEGKLPITHFPRRLILPTTLCFLVIWMAIYQLLIHCTDSSVPIQDSFTSALSIVALWALAHKYAEQWLLWIVVDAISAALYVYKGIPFKASLYSLYVVIAVFGYRKWIKMIHPTP